MNIDQVYQDTAPGDVTYLKKMVSDQLQHTDYTLVDNQYVWEGDRIEYRFVCDTNLYASLGVRPKDILSRQIIKLFPGKGPWEREKHPVFYEAIAVPTGWCIDIQTPPWGTHTQYSDPERNIKWGGMSGEAFLLNAGIEYRLISDPPDFVYVNKTVIKKDFGELI